MDILPSVDSIADYAKYLEIMTHNLWIIYKWDISKTQNIFETLLSIIEKIIKDIWKSVNLGFSIYSLKMSKLDKNESLMWLITGQQWSFIGKNIN